MPLNLRRALAPAREDHAFLGQGYNYAAGKPSSRDCSNERAGAHAGGAPRSRCLFLAAISVTSVQHPYLIRQGAQL